MPARSLSRVLPAFGLGLLLTAGLSGCGQAPWATGLASSTPTATFSVAPIIPVINDLATGSTTRNLKAGDVTLAVNYWSTLNIGEWTPAANKPISFSLIGTLGTDDGQAVYLSRVGVVASVKGPSGPLTAPPASVDQASIAPGYLIKTPYSYSQTFILPAVDPAATSITLAFTYEVLVQSTPTSAAFAKSTASDEITVALTPAE